MHLVHDCIHTMATIVNRSNYSYPVPEDGMLVYHSLHSSTNGVCLCVCVRVSDSVWVGEREGSVTTEKWSNKQRYRATR